ncbi:MAG: Gfo/Idh/MocA family oxidoreductase [Clostridia bacterium]|nr:Gfo/Idh/MocA family oxidoreductase [Clostridia bacterium]
MSLRICVIGCGEMARMGHGPSYRHYLSEYPDTELTACCDVDAVRAGHFREIFGFLRACTDYRQMLREERPDAVCLLVNEEYLCPISCEILDLGIPLLLEKPPGMDVAETTLMMEKAARKNVPHAVALNRRSAPLVNRLRDEVAALQTRVQRFHYEQLRVNRRDPDFSTTAIHGIDALRYIAKADFSHIRFSYREFPELGAGVCNTALECVLTSGASASLLFAPVTGVLTESARVLADDHCLAMTLPGASHSPAGSLWHYASGMPLLEIQGSDCATYFANGFYEENRCFFENIRAGQKPQNTLSTALQSVAVAECIRKRKDEYHMERA